MLSRKNGLTIVPTFAPESNWYHLIPCLYLGAAYVYNMSAFSINNDIGHYHYCYSHLTDKNQEDLKAT